MQIIQNKDQVLVQSLHAFNETYKPYMTSLKVLYGHISRGGGGGVGFEHAGLEIRLPFWAQRFIRTEQCALRFCDLLHDQRDNSEKKTIKNSETGQKKRKSFDCFSFKRLIISYVF